MAEQYKPAPSVRPPGHGQDEESETERAERHARREEQRQREKLERQRKGLE